MYYTILLGPTYKKLQEFPHLKLITVQCSIDVAMGQGRFLLRTEFKKNIRSNKSPNARTNWKVIVVLNIDVIYLLLLLQNSLDAKIPRTIEIISYYIAIIHTHVLFGSFHIFLVCNVQLSTLYYSCCVPFTYTCRTFFSPLKTKVRLDCIRLASLLP
jgi:hypothetical protein